MTGVGEPGIRIGRDDMVEATYANDLHSFQSSVLFRFRFLAAEFLSSSRDRTEESICSWCASSLKLSRSKWSNICLRDFSRAACTSACPRRGTPAAACAIAASLYEATCETNALRDGRGRMAFCYGYLRALTSNLGRCDRSRCERAFACLAHRSGGGRKRKDGWKRMRAIKPTICL
jgi:hypothetical protein